MDGASAVGYLACSAAIGAAVPIVTFIFTWGRKWGQKNQAMESQAEDISQLKSQLTLKNGMPSYITRKEFNDQFLPEIRSLREKLDTYVGNQGEINSEVLSRLTAIEEKFDSHYGPKDS